ncbi:MAG: LLM class flavin-dependent oxidoreductase [Candidatus Lokiarchaeota archaeon]|nr:LLM class flavin-dependent oxidoreductase [Candidatus Lokiarchaeota archaeon]
MKSVSVGITTNMQISATSWIAKNAKSLGANGIWIGEDIDLGQEIFSLTTSTIMQSEGIKIGTGIVPITIHNMSTLARVGKTLNILSNGRFILGLGIGGIQDLKSKQISVNKPVTALRRTVRSLRSLWKGKTVTSKHEYSHLEDYKLKIKSPMDIPIFLGVRGPQMLKLAGEEADGVILSGPVEYLKNAIDIVDKSAESNRRPIPKKVGWLATIPTSDKDVKIAKRVVSLIVADTPQSVIEKLDVDLELVEIIRQKVSKEGPKAGIPYVTEEMMDVFAVSGTTDQMVDKYENLWNMGIDDVVFGPPFFGDWRNKMKEVFQEIREREM